MANRGKEILALCLAVVTLTTAIYTFRSNPGAHYTSPRLGAQTKASRQRVALGVDASKPKPPPRPRIIEEAMLSPLNRNPFSRPAGAPSAAPKPKPEDTPTTQTPTAAAPTPAPTPVPASAPQTPPSLPPLMGQTPPVGTTAVAAPNSNIPILTGIIGDRSSYQTAVIRLGDRRYLAKRGDRVAGRYLVQSVSDRQVVLAGSEGKLILRMGGSE